MAAGIGGPLTSEVEENIELQSRYLNFTYHKYDYDASVSSGLLSHLIRKYGQWLLKSLHGVSGW